MVASKRMSVSWVFLLAFLLLGLGVEASAQEGEPKKVDEARSKLDEQFQPIPQDVLSSFVEAVKSSDHFRVAHGLRREAMEPEIPGWSEEIGFELEPRWGESLDVLRHSSFRNEEGPEYSLRETAASIEGVRVSFWTVGFRTHDGDPRVYRVTDPQLQELDFETLQQLVLKPRFYSKLERYSIQDKTLTSILEELCKLAGIEEYSYRSDEADRIRITQELRGRSIKECLDWAASVAGYKVRTRGIGGGGVNISDIVEATIRRRVMPPPESQGPPPASPREDLKDRVWSLAEELRQNKAVLTLMPVTPEAAKE